MTSTRPIRLAAAALFVFTQASSALAEYRCDPPRSQLDRRACEAARQGPDALRHFIGKIRPIESLHFDDYVSAADVARWDAAYEARRKLAAREVARPAEGEVARP
jgi:hypothetical protein